MTEILTDKRVTVTTAGPFHNSKGVIIAERLPDVHVRMDLGECVWFHVNELKEDANVPTNRP